MKPDEPNRRVAVALAKERKARRNQPDQQPAPGTHGVILPSRSITVTKSFSTTDEH